MEYLYSLALRLGAAFVVLFIGQDVLYKLLFWPMFYISYLLLLPFKPVISGNTLLINNIGLVFVSACVGASAYVLLTLLVLLTKDVMLRRGIKILVTGFIALFIVNIIRIYFLAFILIKFDFKLFETLHLFFWQVLSTLFVFVLWIFITKYYKVTTIPFFSDFKYLLKKFR